MENEKSFERLLSPLECAQLLAQNIASDLKSKKDRIDNGEQEVPGLRINTGRGILLFRLLQEMPGSRCSFGIYFNGKSVSPHNFTIVSGHDIASIIASEIVKQAKDKGFCDELEWLQAEEAQQSDIKAIERYKRKNLRLASRKKIKAFLTVG